MHTIHGGHPALFGRLTASDYEDQIAEDPRVDALRAKMQVKENPKFTEEYYAPDKRYIGNAVQVFFKDGTASPRVEVNYPIGHRKRRAEGMPVLVKKFEASVAAHFGAKQTEAIKKMFADRAALRRCRSAISWPRWSGRLEQNYSRRENTARGRIMTHRACRRPLRVWIVSR